MLKLDALHLKILQNICPACILPIKHDLFFVILFILLLQVDFN